MSLKINVLSPSGAAEIMGLDCSQPFAPDVAAVVRQAFLDHPVLVFRNQPLTAPQYKAFAETFGTVEGFGTPRPLSETAQDVDTSETAFLPEESGRTAPDVFLYFHPDATGVQFMTNIARRDMPLIGIVDNAEMWHVDAQHRPTPSATTILNSVIRPSIGGDTEFSDLTLMYESLPQELQEALDGHMGIHNWSKSRNFMFDGLLSDAAREEGERIAASVPPMHHPLVRRHPKTGRPILFISPRFTIGIEGVKPEVSESLLRNFFESMDDPRFTYRHQWRDHDIVIWENCRLVHRVHGSPNTDVRHLNRITLCGDAPV